jgi:hypothetical protein
LRVNNERAGGETTLVNDLLDRENFKTWVLGLFLLIFYTGAWKAFFSIRTNPRPNKKTYVVFLFGFFLLVLNLVVATFAHGYSFFDLSLIFFFSFYLTYSCAKKEYFFSFLMPKARKRNQL